MLFSKLLLPTLALGASTVLASPTLERGQKDVKGPIAPKVMIISMFDSEDVWTTPMNLTQNITLPGLSPLFPHIACNVEGSICHMTTGEAEINAACSVSAMVLASEFDFKKTYFLIAGIAGVNPFMGTLGSVGLARYAVQVALAYELDSRQIPANWTTGYYLFGTDAPGEYAETIYGTEVYELNTNLRDHAMGFLGGIELKDSDTAKAYRATFDYAPANEAPAVFYGDVSTSDVYFAGNILDEAFGNITSLWTNGTGQYALTAQEDNATFEAMVRAHMFGKLDFSRVVLMRTASDFDRGPAGVDAVTAFQAEQGGFTPAVENIYVAGLPIVEGIIAGWKSTYAKGVAPQDGWLYNADIFHNLVQRKREVRELQRVVKRQAGRARR